MACGSYLLALPRSGDWFFQIRALSITNKKFTYSVLWYSSFDLYLLRFIALTCFSFVEISTTKIYTILDSFDERL